MAIRAATAAGRNDAVRMMPTLYDEASRGSALGWNASDAGRVPPVVDDLQDGLGRPFAAAPVRRRPRIEQQAANRGVIAAVARRHPRPFRRPDERLRLELVVARVD